MGNSPYLANFPFFMERNLRFGPMSNGHHKAAIEKNVKILVELVI